MALTVDTYYDFQRDAEFNFEIVNTNRIFKGSYVGLGSRDHATAATRGRIFAFNDEAGAIPVGFSDQVDTTGDTAATPITVGRVTQNPYLIRNIAVTGLAGTIADVGRLIYPTDDNTFDLARPVLGTPIGIITKFRSATRADVRFFSFETNCAIGMGGNAQQLWGLGIVSPVLAAAGDLLTGIESPYHGRIQNVYAICHRANTDINVNMDIQLEIGGTNLTGGVVTLNFADAVAAKKTGTAITAGNVVQEGSLVDVEALAAGLVAGTATDVGGYNLYAEVLLEPGL